MGKVGAVQLQVENILRKLVSVRIEPIERGRPADGRPPRLGGHVAFSAFSLDFQSEFVIRHLRKPVEFGLHVGLHLRDGEPALCGLAPEKAGRQGIRLQSLITAVDIVLVHRLSRLAQAFQAADEQYAVGRTLDRFVRLYALDAVRIVFRDVVRHQTALVRHGHGLAALSVAADERNERKVALQRPHGLCRILARYAVVEVRVYGTSLLDIVLDHAVKVFDIHGDGVHGEALHIRCQV